MSDITTTSYITANVSHFEWLVILGGIACFAMACGIGANDVANCFGTSVGSKAITLKQAICIAAVFEFCGALFLGAAVTDTVRSGITDYDYFEGEEDLLMLGMFSALCSAALWLFFATKWSLPVSTTQSIVGGIIGFVMIEKGPDAIQWDSVYRIILFWIATPISGALGAVILFYPIRNLLLRRPNDSYKMTLKAWPIFVFLVIFIMTIFLMEKGIKNEDFDFNLGVTAGVSLMVGSVVALISYFIFIRTGLVNKFVQLRCQDQMMLMANLDDDDLDDNNKENGGLSKADLTKGASIKSAGYGTSNNYGSLVDERDNFEHDEEAGDTGTKLKDAMMHGMNVDILADLSKKEENIRDESEKFDPQCEESFAWLQVLTATFAILAHGSNDVANAVAPFAAMIGVFESGLVSAKVEVDWYVLAIGAGGMSIGLSTFGYKVIRCLGARMAAMSSTRGYCIELASATTIILASYYGQPASSTHSIVGATVGVGLLELANPKSTLTYKDVINWTLLGQTFLGWIFTLIISGLTAAGIFSLLAYSPSVSSVCARKYDL